MIESTRVPGQQFSLEQISFVVLVIPGLRLRDVPAAGTALSLVDLQLLNLLPITHSDKQVVHDQLDPL